jgi:hypothetical protein
VATAFSTDWRFTSLTSAVPFNIRDTVLGDTPAMRATWSKVTTVVARAALGDEETDLGVTDFFMSLFLTHKNQIGT